MKSLTFDVTVDVRESEGAWSAVGHEFPVAVHGDSREMVEDRFFQALILLLTLKDKRGNLVRYLNDHGIQYEEEKTAPVGHSETVWRRRVSVPVGVL